MSRRMRISVNRYVDTRIRAWVWTVVSMKNLVRSWDVPIEGRLSAVGAMAWLQPSCRMLSADDQLAAPGML